VPLYQQLCKIVSGNRGTRGCKGILPATGCYRNTKSGDVSPYLARAPRVGAGYPLCATACDRRCGRAALRVGQFCGGTRESDSSLSRVLRQQSDQLLTGQLTRAHDTDHTEATTCAMSQTPSPALLTSYTPSRLRSGSALSPPLP